ncbi:MAG: hypothetical protein R2715_00710 [Ilumatobacteraceae bacterium]
MARIAAGIAQAVLARRNSGKSMKFSDHVHLHTVSDLGRQLRAIMFAAACTEE